MHDKSKGWSEGLSELSILVAFRLSNISLVARKYDMYRSTDTPAEQQNAFAGCHEKTVFLCAVLDILIIYHQ